MPPSEKIINADKLKAYFIDAGVPLQVEAGRKGQLADGRQLLLPGVQQPHLCSQLLQDGFAGRLLRQRARLKDCDLLEKKQF